MEDRLVVCPSRLREALLEDCHANGQACWSKTTSVLLPTPEEKMRQQAQCVPIDIIPINVTGENFDRQASVRRSLVNTDTMGRRARKVRRRKTITGVPDHIQKELGTGESHSHTVYIPGQYSTLGHVGSLGSATRYPGALHSECHTEEMKILPPSARKIQVQKGQGSIVQAGSLCSSSVGTISTLSHSAGVIFASQRGRSARCFHSLPRQGTRASLHSEPSHSRIENGTAGTLSCQTCVLQARQPVERLWNVPGTDVRLHSSCQAGMQSEGSQVPGDPASLNAPHGIHVPSLVANRLLTSSPEVAAPTAVPAHTVETMHSVSFYQEGKPLGSTGVQEVQDPSTLAPVTASPPSCCDSAVLLNAGTLADTESQYSILGHLKGGYGTDPHNESNCSCRSIMSCSPNAPKQWKYETLPRNPLISSCSNPISHICGSLERPSTKADSCSLLGGDAYYTSTHLNSGFKSRSYTSINGVGRARHGMYEYQKHRNQDDQMSLYSTKSLSRSISLRKAKKPPLPPTRKDSLRRKPEKNTQPDGSSDRPNGSVLSETLAADFQESLRLSLDSSNVSSPPQSPCCDYDDSWIAFPHSRSGVSGRSAMSPSSTNMYSICTVTPPQSDSSSLRSDCGHTDSQLSPESQTVSTPGTPEDFPIEELLMGCQTLPPSNRSSATVTDVNMTSSPESMHPLTTPCCGSNLASTPTSGKAIPILRKTQSSARSRPKPKVPERKSSLLSSTSTSPSSTSTSLNSTASATNMAPLYLSDSLVSPLQSPDVLRSPLTATVFPITTAASPYRSPVSASEQNFPPWTLQIAAEISDTCTTSPGLIPSSLNTMMDPDLALKNSSSPPSPPAPPPQLLSPSSFTVCMSAPPPCESLTRQAEDSSINQKCWKDSFRLTKQSEADSSGDNMFNLSYCAFQKSLITAQALQLVQLRPIAVEKLEGLHSADSDLPGLHSADNCNISEARASPPHSPTVNVAMYGTHNSTAPATNVLQDDFENSKLSEVKHGGIMGNSQTGNLKLHEPAYICSQSPEVFPCPAQTYESHSSLPPPLEALRGTVFKQTLPHTSRKPKLTLIVPPVRLQPTTEDSQDNHPQILGANTIVSTSPENRIGAVEAMQAKGFLQQLLLDLEKEKEKQHDEDDNNGEDCTSIPPFTGQEDPLGMSMERQELSVSDEKSTSDGDGDGGSTTGSVSSREDDIGDVFEALVGGEAAEDMVTPARPRTTEDLFAAIHRSKRKVLGWRESEEERHRGPSSSPPVTPTGSGPGLPPLSRQTGSIQRSLRRTATSSDSFKALLLRKGSRSEAGFRMSAAEILKSTDPRHQRALSDSALEPLFPSAGEPCLSPGRTLRAAEEWARSESPLPRFSMAPPGGRHGRSRTPPSAASSRYGARARILSSPMTVICEREGELAEAGDGCEGPGGGAPTGTPPASPTSPQQDCDSACEDSR